jgi:RNA polymerase sigma-70 factor (ECF subfamily)
VLKGRKRMNAPALRYETLSDLELADRAVRRDVSAIKIITTRNNQRLFRAAWSVLRSHTDAEEAVQEAYLKAFTNLSGYSGKSSLSTWLTRIVVNTALDHKRASDRRRTALQSQDVAMIEDQRAIHAANASTSQPPETQLVRSELADAIKNAVSRLPDQYRSVFVLRDIEGMSVRETAQVASLKEATVKSRLHRARHILRDDLAVEIGGILSDSITFAGANCEAMTQRFLTALNITPTGD